MFYRFRCVFNVFFEKIYPPRWCSKSRLAADISSATWAYMASSNIRTSAVFLTVSTVESGYEKRSPKMSGRSPPKGVACWRSLSVVTLTEEIEGHFPANESSRVITLCSSDIAIALLYYTILYFFSKKDTTITLLQVFPTLKGLTESIWRTFWHSVWHFSNRLSGIHSDILSA